MIDTETYELEKQRLDRNAKKSQIDEKVLNNEVNGQTMYWAHFFCESMNFLLFLVCTLFKIALYAVSSISRNFIKTDCFIFIKDIEVKEIRKSLNAHLKEATALQKQVTSLVSKGLCSTMDFSLRTQN